MFSLLAVLITILVLGSVLLWRAIRSLVRTRPRLLRGLWRRRAVAIERLLPSRGLLETRDRRAGTER